MAVQEPHHKSLKTFVLGWAILSLVIIGGISALVLTTDRPALPIAVALTTALTSIGAVFLFFRGLKDYKDLLRRAYIFICAGVVLYALSQLQFPIFAIVDASVWINSGAVLLPYLFSIAFIFWGMRLYSKLIDLHTLWRSFFLAFGTAILAAGLLGMYIYQSDLAPLAIVLQLETLLSIVLFFSAMIAVKIRSIISERYRRPITYMAASFGMLAFSGFHHLVTTMLLPLDSWYLMSELTSLPTFLAALLFFKAGYESAMVEVRDTEHVEEASPIDVITYVASIVSKPAEIDHTLDKLRLITSNAEKRDKLTSDQEKVLADTYLEIEDYLIKNERLRKMDKTRLRVMVRNRFTFDANTKSPFWSLFKVSTT